ncbi:MAG: Mur ligase family protein [Gemmataceae bacterium]
MQLQKVLALRGPNIWANFPVLEAWIDLGPFKDSPSDELPGYNERLKAWLPTMIEHHCSVGERGGFFERLRRGTYQAHILEHITLELQCLAGCDVGFGRARESETEGVYKVAIEYDYEELARAALDTAFQLTLAAIHDQPFDVAGEVEKLRQLARQVTPKAETLALRRAARKRRIPVRYLNDGLLQLGHGARLHRVQGGRTDRTSATAESIARDNLLVRRLHQAIGVPVSAGEVANSADEAWAAAQEIGLPVSLRPRYGRTVKAEWTALQTREQVVAAYEDAADGDPVLVERLPHGVTHRFLVVGGRVAMALRRKPDGGFEGPVPVHDEFAHRLAEAVRVVGLDIAAVEVVTESAALPLEEHGAVLGVQAEPDLAEFMPFISGDPHPIADAIIGSLFPEGENGRVPVVAITGTNGKTTTTRLIAHLLGRVHKPVGMACSEGIYVGSRLIEEGDCSGPKSAIAVLQHPEVQAAVLETARGGVLRAGLGFDRCHVAVVTNIGKGDHLGLSDIHTPEQVAKVKRTIVDVVLPEGAAVLNAADALVADMAQHSRGGVIFFARDAKNPVIVKHRGEGKRAVFDRDGWIILAEGEWESPLVALTQVPLTHGGKVGFNVENALAAAAAAWAVGIPFEEIRGGLETFGSSIDQVPCRFNLFDFRGATVILDYAHNISALESFLEVLPHFPHRVRSVVYAVPGDRTDDVIIRQGELLGMNYDRVVIYEDTELRGRKEGDIFALIRQGVQKGGRTREVVDVRGNLNAIEVALANVRPGELLVIQPEMPTDGADYFRQLLVAGIREIDLSRVRSTLPARAVDVR